MSHTTDKEFFARLKTIIEGEKKEKTGMNSPFVSAWLFEEVVEEMNRPLATEMRKMAWGGADAEMIRRMVAERRKK